MKQIKKPKSITIHGRNIVFGERFIFKPLLDCDFDQETKDYLQKYDGLECVATLTNFKKNFEMLLQFNDNVLSDFYVNHLDDCFNIDNTDAPFELIPLSNFEVDIL